MFEPEEYAKGRCEGCTLSAPAVGRDWPGGRKRKKTDPGLRMLLTMRRHPQFKQL